jgi:hypothetical protein
MNSAHFGNPGIDAFVIFLRPLQWRYAVQGHPHNKATGKGFVWRFSSGRATFKIKINCFFKGVFDVVYRFPVKNEDQASLSQKSGHRSTFLTQRYRQPLLFGVKQPQNIS